MEVTVPAPDPAQRTVMGLHDHASGEWKRIGAAVINSPHTPPTWWHNATYLWMLNLAITSMNAYIIPTKSTLTLRYRVVTHDDASPMALLDKLANEFRQR